MYPNLTNPEILARALQERNEELRREARGLPQAEYIHQKPLKGRALQRRYFTFFAWLYARATR